MARFRKELLGKRSWEDQGQKLGWSAEDWAQKVEGLRQETGLSSLVLRVCLQRGLDSAEAIRQFLYPNLENLSSPFTLKDMDLAVERLVQVREHHQKLRVFGDYDVDGTCGAALLHWLFKDFQMPCDVVQPDRFKDGYGLNRQAVEQAHADGVQVLVTVDCGISSFEALEKARELGLDVIVLDHHQLDPQRGVPLAYAVVNPQRPDCPSGLRQLCGCGVAFYLGMALRHRGRELGWFPEGQMPNLKRHLDLVVLATAADMVPLTGDNRILVRHGLQVLRSSSKPGFKALMEASGLSARSLSPGHLGFTLGPRINASGRMGSASTALEVLCTEDAVKGLQLALQLEKINKERQETQNQIWDQVRVEVEKGLAQGRFQNAVVLGSPDWHEGVVGIVASKVTEIFHKPAIILSLREDFAKGSVRSYGGKDVLQALRSCQALMLGFGGHKMAAGLSLDPAQILALEEAFNTAIAEQGELQALAPLRIEGTCSLDELDLPSLQQLESLAPFGPGNPEPIFQLTASVQGQRVLKDRHLKLNLGPVGGQRRSQTLEAIWFNAAEDQEVYRKITGGGAAHWVGVPEINRFRGSMTPNFRVYDWREEDQPQPTSC